jgi:hypothetical protein
MTSYQIVPFIARGSKTAKKEDCMPDRQDNEEPQSGRETTEIARWVLGISGATILLISAVILIGSWNTKDFAETSRTIFNALLPLFGTWVGTVLAYYFSRKNFESASQSVERMVTLTTEQKLAQIIIEKEMLRPAQITAYTVPQGNAIKDVPLKDLRSMFKENVTRIPIVNANGVVMYIVHLSGLFKFIADKALAGVAGPDMDKLTLQDLVDDAELKNWVTNISYISKDLSVGDAKKAMETRPGCQDLIVTATGNKSEPMLGWMTNVDIGRLSKA